MASYTTTDIAKTGIKREKLKNWMTDKHIEPSIQKASGPGTKNLFSLWDVYGIKNGFDGLVKPEAPPSIPGKSGWYHDIEPCGQWPGWTLWGNLLALSAEYVTKEIPCCRKLLPQTTFWACCLTFCRDGIKIESKRAMMEITTRSSMSVKAFFFIMVNPFL